MNCRYQL